MDFLELVQRRESCRAYTDRPVEREKIEKCIEAARLAPSACDSQPWSFLVVTKPETAAALRPCVQEMHMNRFADTCGTFIVVTEEKPNLSARLGALVKDADFASIDVGIATAHICYEATSLGLSTCILGRLNEKKIKSLLGIDAAKRVRLVLCVGYAADAPLREKKRKTTGEIVTYID